MDTRIAQIAQTVLRGGAISREEARFLSGLAGQALYDLFYWANRIRHTFHGECLSLCSIISARQGMCAEDCKFCAQSAHHRTSVAAYPFLEIGKILHAADQAREMGSRRFSIVTSGADFCGSDDWPRVLEAVRAIAQRGRVAPCASLGSLTERAARELKEAGLLRYHHNLETSRSHFPRLCSTHLFEDRVRTLRIARDAGLEICSGGLFGVGETWEDRIDLALSLREIGVDSVPINFLHPIPGTPLEDAKPVPPLELLTIVALYRFLLPRQEIRICGGREMNLRDLQSWLFYAGANGVMIGNYLTTQGRRPEDDRQMFKDLGFET